MNPTPPVSPRDALAEFAKAFPSTVTDPEQDANERDYADMVADQPWTPGEYMRAKYDDPSMPMARPDDTLDDCAEEGYR